MLKGLFIKEDEEKVVEKRPSFSSTQPVPERQYVPPSTPTTKVSSKVKEAYENEFKKIDTPSIDYYEFHVGIMNAGISKASVDMMYNLLKGMSPTMSKEMMVMQANGAIQKMDNFIAEAYRMSNGKKQAVIDTYHKQRTVAEERKASILAQIQSLTEELNRVQANIDSMSDNSNEIMTIEQTYQEFSQVHNEFKSNVNQIISYLDARL